MDQEFGATGDAEMPIKHRHILMQGGPADAQALGGAFLSVPIEETGERLSQARRQVGGDHGRRFS